MSITPVFTIQPSVQGGTVVRIEADLSRGLHSFSIVGLPGKAIEEAKDRISAALKHSGFPSPKSQNQKIVISLAPADIKKEGPLFDLPIAIAYLLAAELISTTDSKRIFVGELSLDGKLRSVRGVLGVVQTAKVAGFTEVIVPKENAREAALVADIRITAASTLDEVIRHIDHTHELHQSLPPSPLTELDTSWYESAVLFEDIKGPQSRSERLQPVAFHMGQQKFYKYLDTDGILSALNEIHMVMYK